MTIYYVSAIHGDDGNPGTEDKPFATIKRAVSSGGPSGIPHPGDTIIVDDGWYRENLWLARGGSEKEGYVTIKAKNRQRAIIDGSVGKGNSAIQIAADYIALEGLKVCNSNHSGIAGSEVHDIIVQDCRAHDNRGSGITFGRSDYLRIKGNICHHNSRGGPQSGISIHRPMAMDGNNKSGLFRIILTDNICYANRTEGANNPHTDGNGIILDDWRSTHFPERGVYPHRGLVHNNLCYRNGGEGIKLAWTDNCIVQHNTCMYNGMDEYRKSASELCNQSSSNNRWRNNIALANPGKSVGISSGAQKGYECEGVTWTENITWAGKRGDPSYRVTEGLEPEAGLNELGVNPRLIFPDEFPPDSIALKLPAGYRRK